MEGNDWETNVMCDIDIDRDVLDEDGFDGFFTCAGRADRRMPKIRQFHMAFAYQSQNRSRSY